MAMSEDDWLCASCTFSNHPDVISCKTCGTDGLDYHQEAPPSSSQSRLQLPVQKKSSLSVSSAPFVPRNSLPRQQETNKKALSAGMPKTSSQQEADKKTLSASSPSFDPLWRQRMWGSPALTSFGSTTTSTSMSTKQQNSFSARGDAAAAMMIADIFHHPMNTRQGNGGLPVVGIPEQV